MITKRVRGLHPAERKYLLSAARGLTAAETAREHHVSVNTVNTALKHGKAALGARTIAHATALCIVFGEFSKADMEEGF